MISRMIFSYLFQSSSRLLKPALLTAFLIFPAISITSTAQTCRVCMGVNADGNRSYMEVFEYDYVNDKPSFPGGDSKMLEFINSNRVYPREAYKAGVQGRVTCSFIVNSNGSVSHIKVIKSVEESLNREAVRIFSLMPDWTPGCINGHPVPVRVIRSIPFRK